MKTTSIFGHAAGDGKGDEGIGREGGKRKETKRLSPLFRFSGYAHVKLMN